MKENFSIEKVARDYFSQRYEKILEIDCTRKTNDWIRKMEGARGAVDDFRRRVGDPKGMSILDAGSGNGALSIAFAEAGAKVSGVEIEPELVDIANRQAIACHVSPKFHVYDGKKLPFPDNSFDSVISVSVFEHVDDPGMYLKEIWRVLKPSGFLYIAFPNRLYFRETHTGLYGLTYMPMKVAKWYARLRNRDFFIDDNVHFYSFWTLKKLALDGYSPEKWGIMNEKGTNTSPLAVFVKHIMKSLGIPYQAFLPHVMIILKKI
jgi:ubiquinone/menaquinone biosynthesis C-methylase UbiE